jgi:hypothetical protein
MSSSQIPAASHPASHVSWQARLAPWFVWAAWLGMTAWAVLYIEHYALNVPHWDDWAVVPAYAGETPVTWKWLWSQHNEHRIVLPRALMVALLRATGDTRAAMLFSALLLSAAAAVALRTLARFRGGYEFPDAVIPLLLLHPGHGESFLWMFALQNTLFAGLACYLLFAIARHEAPQRQLAVVPFGLALLALPLCGGAGIAMGPFLALWLAGLAVIMFRSGEPGSKRRAGLAMGFALALFATVAVYFVGYLRPEYHPPAKSIRDVLMVTTRFLASGFGGGAVYWPDNGFAAVGLTGFTLWLLARTLLTRREEFQRAAGLTLFFAACGAMAFAVGWGRAGISTQLGFESRHMMYSVLFVCTLYAIWTVCWQSHERRRLLCTALLVLVSLTALRSYYTARSFGRSIRTQWAAFEADARAGVPSDALAARHKTFPDHRYLENCLEMLRARGHGALARSKPTVEVPVTLQPVFMNNMSWTGDTGRGTGIDPYVVLQMPRPQRVMAVRLEVQVTNPADVQPEFQLFWAGDASQPFTEEQSFRQTLRRRPRTQKLAICIGQEIDRLRLDPDVRDCGIEIKSVSLIIEADAAARVADAGAGPKR